MALQIVYSDRFGVTHNEAYLKIESALVEKLPIKVSDAIDAQYDYVVREDGTIDSILISEAVPEAYEKKMMVKSTACIYHSKDTTALAEIVKTSLEPIEYKEGNVFVEAYAGFKKMFGGIDV